MAANCALAAAQPQAALDRAQAAHRLFRSQQSAWWQAHAGLVLAQAQYAAGPASRPAAARGEPGRRPAGGAGLRRGDRRRTCWPGGWRWTWAGAMSADRHLGAAARSRRRGPAMSRASGWLGRGAAGGGRGQIRAACWPPAAAAWRSWTSTGSPSARRSCGPRPPRTAPSWPRSPSATPRRPAGPGCCWPGASAGGPPRWPSPRCGPRPTRNSTPVSPRCAQATRRLEEARRQGVPTGGAAAGAAAARERGPGPLAAGPGHGRRRPGRRRHRGAARPARRRPAHRDRRCRRRPARARLRGRAGCGSSPPAAPRTPSARRTSPGSPCAAWPAAGRGRPGQRAGHPEGGRAGSPGRDPRPGRRPTWATARSSSSRPAGCTRSRGRCCPRWAAARSASPRPRRAWMRARTPPRRRAAGTSRSPAGRAWPPTAPRCRWWPSCMTTSRCCPAAQATAGRVLSALDGAWLAHIAAHGSSAPTARCSRRCACTTGR